MQFLLLSIMVPIGGLAEIISLGAVLPLISFLIDPEKVFRYEYVQKGADLFQIDKAENLGIPLLIAFGALVVGSAFYRVVLLWLITKVSFGCGTDLCEKAYKITLSQPYIKHLARHSSNVILGITGKVAGTANIFQQVLMLLNSLILVTLILGTILFFNPLVTTFSVLVFGVIYIYISKLTRKRLEQNSIEIASESEKILKSIQEGLGAIRNVIIDGSQKVFISDYHKADIALRKAQCGNNVMSACPKFIVEALTIILISVVSFSFGLRSGGIIEVLPVIGVIVLAAQKVLPNIQQIYVAWATISGVHRSLSDAIDLLGQPMINSFDKKIQRRVEYCQKLEVISVSFRYSDVTPMILNNISLAIPRGSRTGIIGATGSGKSTLLDILMGLLTPTSGQLKIDGRIMDCVDILQWQKIIAHVPQSVFLADASLAENIAFGVPLLEIDMERVRHAAKKARIAAFIDGLSDGYLTPTGERGARLSGGQRQRIGIARALYKNAKVLMFDEATSALDDETERSVMEAIDGLGRDVTIILIAHRMSTLQKCDLLLKIDDGNLSVIRNDFDQLGF